MTREKREQFSAFSRPTRHRNWNLHPPQNSTLIGRACGFCGNPFFFFFSVIVIRVLFDQRPIVLVLYVLLRSSSLWPPSHRQTLFFFFKVVLILLLPRSLYAIVYISSSGYVQVSIFSIILSLPHLALRRDFTYILAGRYLVISYIFDGRFSSLLSIARIKREKERKSVVSLFFSSSSFFPFYFLSFLCVL